MTRVKAKAKKDVQQPHYVYPDFLAQYGLVGAITVVEAIQQLDEKHIDLSAIWTQHRPAPKPKVDAGAILHITQPIGQPCPKCKQRDTGYYSKQTRSADEGMTAFWNCKSCGHHWKEN